LESVPNPARINLPGGVLVRALHQTASLVVPRVHRSASLRILAVERKLFLQGARNYDCAIVEL